MSNLILYIVDHCLLNDKPKHNLHKLGAQTTLDFRKPEKNTSNTIITQAYQSRCSCYNTHQARGSE